MLIEKYINYIANIRRYSAKTQQTYSDALYKFMKYAGVDDDKLLPEYLHASLLRSYEAELLGKDGYDPVSVNQYLSIISSFCKFLMKNGFMESNPVRSVKRPKMKKKLPNFYKSASLKEYFENSQNYADAEALQLFENYLEHGLLKEAKELYNKRLSRLIVSILYSTAIRRSELLSLKISSIDFGRGVIKVIGKGDKMREIPIVPELSQEILLYLHTVEKIESCERPATDRLLITYEGRALYPVFVDRVVKNELGSVRSITGRKSPHILRHTLATELLNSGADLNSIKEMLGHSSLAATQIYTHNSISKLKKVYKTAHPRAKKGESYGN